MAEDDRRLTYEPLTYLDRATTERELMSGDERRVINALLAASFEDDDPLWVFEQCLALVADPRTDVRSAFAHAIGHLAMPRGFVDRQAMDVLRRLGDDPAVGPAVDDGVAEVKQALTMRRKGRHH